MTFKRITETTEVSAVDIPTMRAMSIVEYRDYLNGSLLEVDPHGVLRSVPAGYPIACSRAQVSSLIAHLESISHRIGEDV